jgi:hypothetical protein
VLLSHGADPVATDADGVSSLDLAERLAYPEVMAQLVGNSVQSHVESAISASEQRLQVRRCISHVFASMSARNCLIQSSRVKTVQSETVGISLYHCQSLPLLWCFVHCSFSIKDYRF